MARNVAIGLQDFGKIISNRCFYVDITDFIREWWESGDDVTLITRPRRFGKTLNMSVLEQFFSVDYADRGEWFQGLSIWREKIQRDAGYLSGDQPDLCQCEGEKLPGYKGENLLAAHGSVFPKPLFKGLRLDGRGRTAIF